jgi:tetratricopeptide (TPR) repeat protein
MAKVVKFPVPTPEKFGPVRVGKKKCEDDEQKSAVQLNLFSGGGKILRLHPLSPFEEALLLDEQGQRQKAKAFYNKAIAEGDCVADAYCNLGIIETQEGHFPRAIDCFTQSLKHEPRHYEAYYNLANLYAEVGNFELAKFYYQASIEIEPSFANGYFNLGLTLAMSRDFKEAVRVLTEYRQLSPEENHQQTDELIQKLAATL